MKKIKFLLILCCLTALNVFSQVSKNRLKQPTYSWINRQVPTSGYLDSTFSSFWMPLGNDVSRNDLFLGTTSNRSLIFKTNNIQRLKLDTTGRLLMGSPTYTDANVWSFFQTNSNNYSQSIWQNINSGSTASTDLIISNDLGTKSTYYGDFGMNSSGYTGSSIFNKPNAVYLYGQDGDLAVGTSSNNSFYIATNSTRRTKVDSIGSFTHYGKLTIDQTNGINSVSPKKLSFQPYTGDNSYPAIYIGQNIPSSTNYFFVGDSTFSGINGAKILYLRQGAWIGMSLTGAQNNGNTGTELGGGLVTHYSCASTATSVVNGFIPMVKYASLTYSLSGGTVPNFYIEQRQQPNIKSTTATTLTNYQPYNFPPVTFDAGVTITNNYGLRNDNNFTNQGKAYIGGLVAPSNAILEIAGGGSTVTAIKFTNQVNFTSGTAGAMWYNSTTGLQFNGNFVASGTFSAGSTGTIGAGLRVVGALSVTTTGSIGTTFTVGGASAMNGIANTGSITTSTTFSCGTTATLGGQAQTNGITNTGTLSCSGASTLTGAVTVQSNLTGSGSIKTTSKTNFIGYAAGSGSMVTQASSRTTGVTCNSATGIITLVSAAGTSAWTSFTVTNTGLGANDLVEINQIAGADTYIYSVKHNSSGSFVLSFSDITGTTVEQPSFLFTIVSGQTN